MVRLDPLDFCLARLDHARDARSAGEHLRRGHRGCGTHEHAGQVSVILLGKYASELHDASRVGVPIDEDDDLPY